MGDVTFISAIDKDGNLVAWSYSGQLSAPTVIRSFLETDDHDNPSLLVRNSDSRIMAFYSKHNGDDINFKVSTNPLDVSSFGAEQSLDAEIGLSTYTYTNPVQLTGEANDPIYLFFRAPDGTGRPITYTKSIDDGASWSAAVHVMANGAERPYFRIAQNGNDRIDFCHNDGHPREVATNSIYHFYYQAGNFYKTDGTLISDVASLPFGTADVTKVYDGTSIRSWVWDIAIDASGHPVIVYATFPTPETDHRYRYARWNGASWDDNEICAAGGRLFESEIYYSGGVALDHSNSNIVYASRNTGSEWHLYRYTTANGGASFTEQAIVTNKKAIRPVVSRGGSTIIYLTGTYNSFTDYDTEVSIV